MSKSKNNNLYVTYGKTKYKAIEHHCDCCGKLYLAAARWFHSRTHHYCCKECAALGNKNFNKAKKLASNLTSSFTPYNCEHCGKLVLEYFGSGRFCSRACANSRTWDTDHKQQLSISIKKPNSKSTLRLDTRKTLYKSKPNYCVMCNTALSYEKRHNKTCSIDCLRKYLSKVAKNSNFGGLTSGGAHFSKKGCYHNIHCDSTYELIYLIYCLEHNIKIERNIKFFKYFDFNNNYRKYYPDFYLPESNTFVEIKGYKDRNVDLKIAAVQKEGHNIVMLQKLDLEPMLDFINTKFNKNYNIKYANIAELYE